MKKDKLTTRQKQILESNFSTQFYRSAAGESATLTAKFLVKEGYLKEGEGSEKGKYLRIK
jgi:hypothetical protein